VRLTAVSRTLTGHRRRTMALAGVDLEVVAASSVAVVGRSGSGKSTLVGVLAALDPPDSGTVLVDGQDVWAASAAKRRLARRRVGLVFQDALTSFDPRWRVGQVVSEAGHGRTTPADVAAVLEQVGLDGSFADRRPSTLSGGQRQRVALARALAGSPGLLLADEPTSGLDVVAQRHLLDLLARVRQRGGLTCVVVTHDLRVARQVAERIVVLDGGQVVEDLPSVALDDATHPATRALLDAVPVLPTP